jgi:hypothetical protein
MIYHLNRKCGLCQGTGMETEVITNPDGSLEPGASIVCRSCGGDGVREALTLCAAFGDMVSDMNDKINDCIDKLNDIQEQLNED